MVLQVKFWTGHLTETLVSLVLHLILGVPGESFSRNIAVPRLYDGSTKHQGRILLHYSPKVKNITLFPSWKKKVILLKDGTDIIQLSHYGN